MAELDNKEIDLATQGLEDNEPETMTLTKEQLNELLQKEGDRRVSSALKKQEQKQREAERLKGMSDSQKLEYELAERERLIEEKERQLTLAENKAACLSILADKGLDPAFADFVVSDQAEIMQASINIIEKAFKKSVKDEIQKRLGSPAPKKAEATAPITRDSLKKMSLKELQQFASENPEEYKALMG